jgi:hypothetical protein
LVVTNIIIIALIVLVIFFSYSSSYVLSQYPRCVPFKLTFAYHRLCKPVR